MLEACSQEHWEEVCGGIEGESLPQHLRGGHLVSHGDSLSWTESSPCIWSLKKTLERGAGRSEGGSDLALVVVIVLLFFFFITTTTAITTTTVAPPSSAKNKNVSPTANPAAAVTDRQTDRQMGGSSSEAYNYGDKPVAIITEV